MTEKRSSSRSEEVRLRRSREQVSRQKKVIERAYRPAPAMPARDRTARVTPRRETGRRFNIAVGLPQSRFQVPSLPRIQPGWRMVSLALSLALAVALYLLWNLPYFRVGEVTVTGLVHLSPSEINIALGASGQSIFGLRPDEMETNLRIAYPELSSVHVRIGLPNQVQVEVVERQPVLLWQLSEGYTWIDANGVAFRPRGEVSGLIPVMALATPPVGRPILSDPLSPLPYLPAEMVKSVQILSASLPAGTTMLYDARNGFGWNDPQGWQVFFGTDSRDMALKVRVYQSLVTSLTARGIYPALISVLQVDAPYYRMAQ